MPQSPDLHKLAIEFWNNGVQRTSAFVTLTIAVWGLTKKTREGTINFFKGIAKRVDDRLRKHYTQDEPETIDGEGFLPDRRKPQWEVHASPYFNQPVTVVGTKDGTGWRFRIPVYVRNMGIRLTPSFLLEVHSHSPYLLREIRDWNGILLGEYQNSELADKNLFWQKVTFKHLTPLSITPEHLGDIILTIHGPVRIPPVLKLTWRVVLSGRRYYPADSYGWFNVNLETQVQRNALPDTNAPETAT